MILKVLLVLAVIGTVYFMFIKKKPLKDTESQNKKNKRKENLDSNDMVECETCGIYSQLDESILSGSKYYCSTECLEKA